MAYCSTANISLLVPRKFWIYMFAIIMLWILLDLIILWMSLMCLAVWRLKFMEVFLQIYMWLMEVILCLDISNQILFIHRFSLHVSLKQINKFRFLIFYWWEEVMLSGIFLVIWLFLFLNKVVNLQIILL